MGEDCLQRERERGVQQFFKIREAIEERVFGEVERRPVKTLSGINVLAAHA